MIPTDPHSELCHHVRNSLASVIFCAKRMRDLAKIHNIQEALAHDQLLAQSINRLEEALETWMQRND